MTTTITIQHNEGEKQFSHSIAVGDVALAKVLHRFNVTDDPRVTVLKALSAAQIQMMLEHQAAEKDAPAGGSDTPEIHQARMRCASIAITLVEGAQMALVKSLFALA